MFFLYLELRLELFVLLQCGVEQVLHGRELGGDTFKTS
jgi:hypothetical protein